MLTKEETNLINNLRQKVEQTLNFVSSREKILSKTEGEIQFVLPARHGGDYYVRISSYLMNSSNIQTEWAGKTLKIALQKAISGVQFWNQFEREATPFSNGHLSNVLIEDYI